MGRYKLKKIQCQNNAQRGVYCLQYDDEKIVSGLRDNTIKVSTLLSCFCIIFLHTIAALMTRFEAVLCFDTELEHFEYAHVLNIRILTGVLVNLGFCVHRFIIFAEHWCDFWIIG